MKRHAYSAAAVIGIWVFAVHAATAKHPFLNPALLADRNFVVGTFFSMVLMGIMFGTLALMPDADRALVRGLVINRFRGDAALLGDAIADGTLVPPAGTVVPAPTIVGGHSAGGHFATEVGKPLQITCRAAALLDKQPHDEIQKKPLDQKPYWHVERARVGTTRTVPVELIVNGESVAKKEIPADGSISDVSFDYVPTLLPYFLALAASSFLYVAMADLIPGLHRGLTDATSLRQILLIALGILTMFVF